MAVPDWLGFPKEGDDAPRWGLRANAWMNELRGCVTDLSTRVGVLEATPTGGTWAAYTPTVTGLSMTGQTSRYTTVGKLCVVTYLAEVVSSSNTFVTVSLPVNAASHLVGRTGHGQAYADDISSNLRYEGIIRFDSATTLSFRYPNFTNFATTAWHGNSPAQPHAWAGGDFLDFTLSYETV